MLQVIVSISATRDQLPLTLKCKAGAHICIYISSHILMVPGLSFIYKFTMMDQEPQSKLELQTSALWWHPVVLSSNSRSLGDYKDVGNLARGGKVCFERRRTQMGHQDRLRGTDKGLALSLLLMWHVELTQSWHVCEADLPLLIHVILYLTFHNEARVLPFQS